MKYIIFSGLFQAVFSLLLLLTNKKKDVADNILIFFLASIGWHLMTKFYIFTELGNPSVSSMMHTFIQLSYGPLLYLYSEKKGNKQFVLSTQWYLFIPLLMSIALYASVIITYFCYPDKGIFMLNIYNMMVFPPIIATHLIFGILIIFRVRNKDIAEYFLIRNICLLLIGLSIAEICLNYNVSAASHYILLNRSIIYLILGTVPVLIVGNKFLRPNRDWESNLKQQLFQYQLPDVVLQIPGSIDSSTVKISRKLLLDSSQHREVFKKIETLIKYDQRFKEEDISLEKLAAISGISRHYISETLNVYAKKSFYQYVNECRIEEVKNILDNNQKNESLVSIAYRSGFKNKSSFNSYFKNITGYTPSDYIKAKEINS